MTIKSLTFNLLVLSLFIGIGITSYFFQTKPVFGAAADHLVISEVQIAGAIATDEFIELYNPTHQSITMEGYRLIRLTGSGTPATLVSSLNATIPARSYFLIKHPDSPVTADLVYSAASNSIASNATVILLSSDLVTQIDKVGMGSASEFETISTSNPPTSGSIERKANSNSSIESMTEGSDQFLGNGEDSNNNQNDFIVRSVSQPQNSSSTPEPVSNSSPSPVISPSASPSISPSPTILPSPVASVIPTPTLFPTIAPSPIPNVSPSPNPSISPSPSSTPKPHHVHERLMVCGWTIKTIESRFFSLSMPIFGCKWVNL